MSIEEIEDLYFAWQSSQLTFEELQEMEQLLASNSQVKEIFEELQSLDEKMETTPYEKPSSTLRDNFLLQLEEEKASLPTPTKRGSSIRMPIWAVAASVSLIVGISMGWWAGRQTYSEASSIAELNNKIMELQQAVSLTQFGNQSASQRLAAIQASITMQEPDDRVINSLLTTLQSDPSDNVRVAAAEALAAYGDKPQVSMGLAKSLSSQKDPFLQLLLIEILVQMEEKSAIHEFNKLVNNQDAIEQVRLRAEEGIGQLL